MTTREQVMLTRLSHYIFTLHRLEQQGTQVALVFIRLLLAVEFGMSGWEKWRGKIGLRTFKANFPGRLM